MRQIAFGIVALLATVHAAPSAKFPSATVRNGTYSGVRSDTYDQDFFLGIPYAQQPVGDLRFTVPQSLNETWSGSHDAKEYSDICVGYGVSIYSILPATSHVAYRGLRRTLSGIRNQSLVLLSMLFEALQIGRAHV